MTTTQICILILALVAFALSVVAIVSQVRHVMKFRAVLKRASAIVERGQGEAYESKSTTLHEIVERELGPHEPRKPTTKVSNISRKPKSEGGSTWVSRHGRN